MPTRLRTRRDILRDGLAAGILLVPARWTEPDVLHAWLEAPQAQQPTAHVEMGPFYKRRAPASATLRRTGDPGLPLNVTGRLISTHGEPVAGATVEIWQANHGGLYALEAITIARRS